MRILWLAVALLVALPVASLAKEYDTIDELVGAFSDETCKTCHAPMYSEWMATPHSDSINLSLNGMRNFLVFGVKDWWGREANKRDILKCLDCHAPVVKYASEKLAVEIADLIVTTKDSKDADKAAKAKAQLSRLNVGCVGCHNIKATAIAIGRLGEPVEGMVYGVKGKASPAHKTIKSAELKTSAFCMQCHGIFTSPDGETIQCNTLSGSYQDGYVSRGGSKTCQDCHMKENNRGHKMLGGRDLELVKEGIGFSAGIAKYLHLPGKGETRWTPSAIVNVELENRAGHRIPDG